MAVVLPPGQTADYSSTITVASGEAKLISIYTDTAGVNIPTGVEFIIEKMNAAGNWQEVYDVVYGKLKLTSKLYDVVLTAVGSYRLRRKNITSYGVNIGVSEELNRGTVTPFELLSLFEDGDTGAWYDPQQLDSLFQEEDGTGDVASDNDPVGFITDLSGFDNHATQATVGFRGVLSTREGLKIIQLDFTDDSYDWPFDGVTGTFAFASPYGAQVFTLDADTYLPRIQFTEAFFIDRILSAEDSADLLAYMETKCPVILWDGEVSGTTLGIGGYSFDYYTNMPSGALRVDFSDSSTIDAPPPPVNPTYYYNVATVPDRTMFVFASDTPEVIEGTSGGYDYPNGATGVFVTVPNIMKNSDSGFLLRTYCKALQGTVDAVNLNPDVITHLVFYSTGNGKLVGRFPDLSEFNGLKSASFRDMNLTGEITSLNNKPTLYYIDFAGNPGITGPVPDFTTLPELYQFNVQGCTAMTAPDGIDLTECPNLNRFETNTQSFNCAFPDLSNNSNLRWWQTSYCGLTGTLSNMTHATVLTRFVVPGNTGLTGDLPSTNSPNLHLFWAYGCGFDGLIGSFPQWGTFGSGDSRSCYLHDNQLTGVVPGFAVHANMHRFYAHNNLLTQAAVDAILHAFVVAGATATNIQLHGTGNAAPSAAGLADKATLITAGCTVATN